MEQRQRPRISQVVIDEFTKLIDSQDDKGIQKYGTTIDEASHEEYDWKLMALEETADLQKYLLKKIDELQAKVAELKSKSSYQRYEKIEKENLELAKKVAVYEKELDRLYTARYAGYSKLTQ